MDKQTKPTILVVEDEPIILMDAVWSLEQAGFVCLEAGNADEASLLLRTHPEIAALFTDIEMRGDRTGLDLALEAHTMRPNLAVAVASGRVCPLADQMPPRSVFFTKPYKSDAVADALQNLLAA